MHWKVPDTYLHIAVGVIPDNSGTRVLLSKRRHGVPQGGLWEFPGGKVGRGETVQQALSRELREELGIHVTDVQPLIQVRHQYPDQKVFLDVWTVKQWTGKPSGREGQQIEWVEKSLLREVPLPQANYPIVTAATLPGVYGITPDLAVYDSSFYSRLQGNLASGLKLLQFRARQLGAGDTVVTLRKVHALCEAAGCRLLLNGTPQAGCMDFISGVHLNSSRLMQMTGRELGDEYLISASCHDRRELQQAALIGVDFAVLSPVNRTGSHAGVQPIGWEGFAGMLEECSIPVYALGGMRETDLEGSRYYGAQGIAMLSGLWD